MARGIARSTSQTPLYQRITEKIIRDLESGGVPWLDIIQANHRATMRVASATSKCADFLLTFRPGLSANDNDDPGDAPARAICGRAAA